MRYENWASARIPLNESSRTEVEALAKNSAWVHIAAPASNVTGSMNLWGVCKELDRDAVQCQLGILTYRQYLEGGTKGAEKGIEQVSSANRPSLFCRSGPPDGGGHPSLDFLPLGDRLELSLRVPPSAEANEPFLAALDILNFIPTFGEGVIDGEKVQHYLLEATSATKSAKSAVYRLKDGYKCIVSSVIPNIPYRYSFFFDSFQQPRFLQVLPQVFQVLGWEPARFEIIDRPHEKKYNLPPPEGVWDVHGSLTYKEGFDPFFGQTTKTRRMRYPLLQHRLEDAEIPLWQIDAVHTPDDSFLDIQSPEGVEYLKRFLEEHKFEGKLWEGDFTKRWSVKG